MFPVVVATFDKRVLTLSVHILRPCTDRMPDILQGGVPEDDNQLCQHLIHLLDLCTGIRKHLMSVLLCHLLFGDAGII